MELDPTNSIIPQEFLWLFEAAIGLFLVSFFSLLARKVLKGKAGKGRWKNFQRISYLPIQVAIWGVGVSLVIDILSTHLGLSRISLYIRHVCLAFVLVCLSWIAMRSVRLFFDRLYEKTDHLGVNTTTLYALRKLTSVVIAVLSLLILLQIFGLNMLPLLTFGGIGVAGIAFAAQDVIANFFGGVMLHFAHPFDVGDQIEVPSQNNFIGRVEEIGWYGTVLRDSDKRQVFFPNSLFSKAPMINLSRRTHYRILEKIPLRYQDLEKAEKFVEALRVGIAKHPKIDPSQNFYINLSGYGLNSAEVQLDVLTFEVANYQQVKQEVLLLANELANVSGVEVLPMSYVQNYS